MQTEGSVSNQLTKVTERLRTMIMRGALAQGERITESSIAEKLGVSRTPVRLALAILEQEDLVEGAPNRGFRVREFTLAYVKDAIAVRSTLEGMAARLAAERGLNDGQRETLERCNATIERLAAQKKHRQEDLETFSRANEAFHATIAEAAASPALTRLLDREAPLPFRSAPLLFALEAEHVVRSLRHSASDHALITEAILAGEGTRAEFLMREHALIPMRQTALLMRRFGPDGEPNALDLRSLVA